MAHKIPTPFTRDGMLAVIQQLEGIATSLQTVADTMNESGVERIPVFYAKSLRESLPRISTFVQSADSALAEVRMGFDPAPGYEYDPETNTYVENFDPEGE